MRRVSFPFCRQRRRDSRTKPVCCPFHSLSLLTSSPTALFLSLCVFASISPFDHLWHGHASFACSHYSLSQADCTSDPTLRCSSKQHPVCLPPTLESAHHLLVPPIIAPFFFVPFSATAAVLSCIALIRNSGTGDLPTFLPQPQHRP